MRHRGVAYPFPLAYYFLDTIADGHAWRWLIVWDCERADRGIPSIFG